MVMTPYSLPAGLVKRLSPTEVANTWWATEMVRWREGVLQPIGGFQRMTASPMASKTRHIHNYRDVGVAEYTLFGADSHLFYMNSAGGITNITPASFVPFSTLGAVGGFGVGAYGVGAYGVGDGTINPNAPFAFWTMANWGKDVVMTASSDGRLLYYTTNTPTTAPIAVTGAPIGNKACIVTPERFVMLIGEGGNPRNIGWCSRENINDWNYASTTNTAGFLTIPSRTPLETAVIVKDGILLFSRTEVYIVRYSGLPYVYGYQYLGDTAIINPESIALYQGNAAWFTKEGIWKYEAGGGISRVASDVWDYIQKNEIDSFFGQQKGFAYDHGTFPEIWFYYPSIGNPECNKYLIWNYLENWFSTGTMARTAMCTGTLHGYPIKTDALGYAYEHDKGWTENGDARAANGKIYAETSYIKGSENTLALNQIMPSTGFGAKIDVTLYGRYTPEGAETAYGAYTCRSDGYIDTRAEAKFLRLRFTPTQDGLWSVGEMTLDVEKGSRR